MKRNIQNILFSCKKCEIDVGNYVHVDAFQQLHSVHSWQVEQKFRYIIFSNNMNLFEKMNLAIIIVLQHFFEFSFKLWRAKFYAINSCEFDCAGVETKQMYGRLGCKSSNIFIWLFENYQDISDGTFLETLFEIFWNFISIDGKHSWLLVKWLSNDLTFCFL